MKITRMKTNHLTNPLGYRIEHPVFSWNAESDGKTQTSARVQVSLSPDFSNPIYDSGDRSDISCTGFSPEFALSPRTRYYWRVTVEADNGDKGTSDPAWFETALDSSGWQARWIAPSFSKENSPIFQKTFRISGEINAPRLYICGLGVYEAYLNGEKIGDEYLLPGFHAYDFWQQYQTFDLSGLLREGENALSVLVGNGWYKGRFGFTGNEGERYGDQFRLIAQVMDGENLLAATGESWKCAVSPLGENSIYDGEFYDGSREIPGWNCPGGEKDWQPAVPADMGLEQLSPRMSPPITGQERFPVAEIIHTPAGETVFDFGQEVTGWVEFVNRAPKGTKITIGHGEILQGGNFYTENLRSAKAVFTYISSGREEVVRPHATFFGFRYIRVEGLENPDPADFTALVIHSDLERTGSIKTSDEKINRLILNTLWGQKGNFLDVPTDCPQRDERMGWTGDAQAFCFTASYHMDTSAFYAKYLQDMMLEQKAQDGAVPHVVPVIKKDGKSLLPGVSCAWADAATVIPWTCYLHSGDRAALAREYPAMKMWTDYLYRLDEKNGGKRLWLGGEHFADWLSLDNYKDPGSCSGGTNADYIASAYYAYSSGLTAKAAAALGKTGEAAFYAQLSGEVKNAFFREFFTPTGRCAINTQTAYALALYMDLVPGGLRPRLVEELRKLLKENNMHLSTGFVGTTYLCRVLSAFGAAEDAYTLLFNEDYPSWLYEVNMGATTIWERWNSVLPDGSISDTGMNSLNHYAYGSIAGWMYQYMGGISPREDFPGFARISLTPQPGKQLEWAEVAVDTASGRYESAWKREGEKVAYTFRVPFNCRAELRLPAAGTVDGRAVAEGETVVLTTGPHHAVTQ